MAKKTENEVKETKKEAAVMDEAAKEKFQQKLKDLLALAKKKKNMLEYQEISDFFADMQLEAEQFDKILDFLEANNIDVLRITDDDSDDEILLDVDDEDEIEVEKIDLSVPDGVHQFMRFLKHVIAERKRGLLLVPGAAVRGEQGFDNGPHCLQRGNRGAFAGLCRSVRGLCRRARGGMYG